MTQRGENQQSPKASATDPFAERYPHLAAWVQDGWVEIGQDDYSKSFVRALDAGGMVWEGRSHYGNIHDALQALDAGIAEWLDQNG